MQLETKKLLEDIRQAAERTVEFTDNKTLNGYNIVGDPVVWDLATNGLPKLHAQVRILLGTED
jgi:uncharacterized protein with HEPN domain